MEVIIVVSSILIECESWWGQLLPADLFIHLALFRQGGGVSMHTQASTHMDKHWRLR